MEGGGGWQRRRQREGEGGRVGQVLLACEISVACNHVTMWTRLLQIPVSSVACAPTPMDPSPANVLMALLVFDVSTAPSAKHNRHVPLTSPVLPR